jgi:hypothetical protein
MNIARGRDFFINSDATGYEPVDVGKIYITLDNSDGRFDPYNTDSPLYPNVIPGKEIQIYVQNGSTYTNYWLFTGYIDDIQPMELEKQVTITAVDLIRQLKEQNINIAVDTSITYSNAVEAILDEAGITDYAVDTDLNSIPYWWVTDKTPFQAIQEISDATLGTFFIAADGKAKFYNRVKTVSSTISPTQSDLLRDMSIKNPWEVVKNAIEVKVNTRIAQSSGVIWTLRDVPLIAAGGSLEVWGTYSYNDIQCPAIDVLDPVSGTDFTMNTDSGGGGTNSTSDFTVTKTDFGGTVKEVITNNGATNSYVTLSQIKGKAITKPDPTTIKKTDTASITLYKEHKFTVDSDWMQTTGTGTTLAEVILDLHADGRKFPIIRMQMRPELQFAVDLFDRISLSIVGKGISDAYRVGKIEHQWLRANGQDVVTTLHLEPVINVTPTASWVFPMTFPTVFG